MSLQEQPDLLSGLDYIERFLKNEVTGQDETIDVLISVVERYCSGLCDPRRPIGSFLFLGPSGVGKTFLVETFAELALPPENFVPVDCSEYNQDHQVARMLGAPPGYRGEETGSIFVNAVRRMSQPELGWVLLLDEIEKAHPKFFDIFLQVLSSGRITDGRGNVVDFSRCLIFMTSNIGASEHSKGTDMGFRSQRSTVLNKKAILAEVKKTFRIEFINRIDHIAFFNSLTLDQQQTIFTRMLRDVNRRLRSREIKVLLGDRLHEVIFNKGFSHEFGARNLSRAIADELSGKLSKKIIRKEIQVDSLVEADHDEHGEFAVRRIGDYPILMEEESQP